MARYLRSTGEYRLGKPTVVGASTVFDPLGVTTVAVRTAQHTGWRATTYRLRRVRAGSGGTTDPLRPFAPIVVTLASQAAAHRRFYKTQYQLTENFRRAGGSFDGQIVFAPVKVSLARAPYPRRHITVLSGPTVAGAVVSTTPPFSPVQMTLAQPPRQSRQAASRLRPPATLAAAAALAAIRVKLAQPPRQARVSAAALNPPSVVGASATFPPVRVSYVRTPRQARRAVYALRGPTVAGDVTPPATTPLSPVGIRLARMLASRRSVYVLGRPTVIGAATDTTPAPPLDIRLAKARSRPSYRSWLHGPTVVAAASTYPSADVHLAARVPYRRTTYRLRAPAVVGQAAVFGPVKVKTVTRPRQAGDSLYRLQPPTIMGTVTPPPTPPVTDVGGPGGPSLVSRHKGLTHEEWLRKRDQEEVAIAIAILWGDR